MISSSVPGIGLTAAVQRCGEADCGLAWAVPGMPRSRLQYVPAKDGLPARQVGPWVERKAHYVDYYADMFATGMKKWPRRAYVELFAGTGVSWDYGHRVEIDGSAVRALRRDFTEYVFVDIDDVATGALAQRVARVARRPGQHPPRILTADCNDAIPTVRAAIDGAICLAFVDPTNWQVRFESIAELVRDRRVDLLFTFHHGAMRRVRDAAALDAFFDTSQWQRLVQLPQREVAGALIELYNRQLERLGYLDTHSYRVPVRNRKNVVMYDLVVFTRAARGVEFWRKTLSAPDEAGQRGFWPS